MNPPPEVTRALETIALHAIRQTGVGCVEFKGKSPDVPDIFVAINPEHKTAIRDTILSLKRRPA